MVSAQTAPSLWQSSFTLLSFNQMLFIQTEWKSGIHLLQDIHAHNYGLAVQSVQVHTSAYLLIVCLQDYILEMACRIYDG